MMGLDRIGGVRTNKGFIQTDGWSRTGAVGVYVIGDVAGPPCLAYKASHEGIACVEHLAGVESACPQVTGQIQGLAIAQQLETIEHELMHTIFPPPTLSEAIHESVLAACGRAIHS